MATIDELSIEVQSSAKKVDNSIDKAAKQLEHLASATSKVSASKLNSISVGLNNISKSLRGLKDVSSAIKSLQGLSNISNATKGLEKVKKSADGLKDIKADIDTKDFDSAVDELQKRFKDVGTDFSFKGDSAKLEKTISNLENSLDRLYEKQDEMRDLGVDFDSRGFVKLQRDIALTSNKLGILNSQMDKVKKESSQLSKSFAIQRNESLTTGTTIGQPKTKMVSAKSLGYDADAMKAVFGESAQGIKNFNDAIKKLGSGAGSILNGIENDFGEIENSAKKATESVSDVGGNLKKSFKDAELSADEFEEYLENLQMPDIRTDNLKKLQSEFERTEKKLDELTVKSDNWAAKGINPDSVKFRNLQEQIVATSKKSEALRKKIKEVSQTRPNVSGWQKLTTVASTIDKAFGAIKRGVSSALSSIKKLGRGFQNLGSVVKKVSSAIGKMFSNIVQLASKATSAITSSVRSMTNAFSKLRGESSGIQRASSGISGLVRTAGSLLAVKGVADFGKSAIELGSNITEVENVVDTAFGSMAGKVYDFAKNAASQFGLSELAAKQYSGTMMAMLKSSGVAQGAASDMSIALAGLAGDLASFYNIETDEAFRKLRAGISGETEPLKQLGINMNIANLEAYAMANGINKAYKEMTLAEQTTLRYNYIIAKTGDAQGDFARTAGTWANQLRLLRLNIQSISAIIGQGLIAALLPAIKLLNKFMAKLTEVAKKFRDFMYVLFGKKIEAPARGIVNDMAGVTDYTADLSGIGDSAQDVEDGMEDAADGMDTATNSAKKLKKALSVLGFDELHQLNKDLDDLDTSKVTGEKDKDKDKDLGLDDLGIGNMDNMFDDLYDKQEIEPVNEWARRLREAFLAHDWEELGKIIAEMVNTGLKKIYDVIKALTPKVESALRAFAKVFNSFVKWLDWDLLGRTIGAGINLLARAFNALFGPGGIDLEQLGRKLSVGFRGMVDEIEWRTLGNAIGNGFMIAWRIASGFVEDMWRINPNTLLTGWAETGIALAEAVHGIFERINFKQIGDTISGGFNGIVEIIRNFRNQMAKNNTWSMIAIGVSEGLNSIIDNIDLSKAAQQISGLALDILHAMNKSAELTHWEEFGYKVAEGLFAIPWLQLFNQVFDLASATFGRAIGGFVNYLTTHAEQLGQSFADVFNTLFDKIKYITSNIPWDDIGTGISTFLNTSIEKIKPIQAATNLGNFVTSLLDTMLQVAQNTNWNELGVAIGNFLASIPWGTMFRQAFDIVTTTIGGLVSGIGSTLLYQLPAIGTAMAEGFNYAMERLREFVANVSWEDIGLYISAGINNLIIGVDWVTAGETLSNFVRGLLDVFYAVAMNTDWEAFGRSIGEFLGSIDWLGILTEFALSLGTIIAEVIDGLRETVSGNVVLAIGGVILAAKGAGLAESALEIVNQFAHNFGLLPKGVDATIPDLVKGIGKITEDLLPKISSVASTVVSKAGSVLKTIGTVIFSPTGALIAGIAIGVVLIIKNWDKIKEAAGKVKDWVSEKFSQLKDSVSKSMDKLGEAAGRGWNKVQEKFQSFNSFLGGIFARDWSRNFGSLGDVFNGFNANVANIWESVKQVFRGVINFVAGTFTGNWSRAWQGVRDIFGGIWNGLAAVVKAPVNTIIGIMNSLISAVAFAVNSIGEILNGLKIDIPDWVPVIGGKKLKFNFPKWTPGKFHYLAQGGVLKRGQMGFLEGSGAEAVVPLEKNRQWISRVSEEMARNNYNYSGGINEDTLANAVAEGVAMALMNNVNNLSSNNQRPINITVKLENDEAIARAAIRGQQSIDYRMNPTPQFG